MHDAWHCTDIILFLVDMTVVKNVRRHTTAPCGGGVYGDQVSQGSRVRSSEVIP